MPTKLKPNRLGEILVRKGIISHEQLKIAINEQNHRRKILHTSHSSRIHQSTCLGEILTELKFIDRTQLKRGLNWQLILRKMTMALALCAPLMSIGSAHAAISTKTLLSVPTTLQSENFSQASGVKNEITTDLGGGFDTGAINAGDWMNYIDTPVNIPVTGYYIVSYRVSSLRGGGSFIFNNVGAAITKIDRISVPKTGGWQTWITIQRKVYLKAGPHYFSIRAVVGGFNLNWFKISSAGQNSSSVKTSSSSSVKSSSSISAASSPVSSKATTSKSSTAASVKSSMQSSSKISSASVKSSVSSSKKSSSSSSSKSSSSSSSLYIHVAGPVALSWLAPKQREDKTILDITELGGYQLRYKSLTDTKYTSININDPWTTIYNFSWMEGDYIFQIAAFDKTGALSDFVNFSSN